MAVRNATTVVSTKGQVILPKAVRDALHWGAGQRLKVEIGPEGVILKSASPFAATRIEDVFGKLDAKGTHVRIEDFDAAIAEGVRKRHAGGRY